MSFEELPRELSVQRDGGRIRISLGSLSTAWLDEDDAFLERICEDNINPFYRKEHLGCEIEIKNVLDRGAAFLDGERYKKAIESLDDVLHYDPLYGEALIFKSLALYGQRHFVKALRFYRKSVRAGFPPDIEYEKTLMGESSRERDAFPPIKRNIYAGDEAASRKDFASALKFYDRALLDTSDFKSRILSKLLMKKADMLVGLERFGEAMECFEMSIDAGRTDSAYFGLGYCRYMMGMDCEESLKRAVGIDLRHVLSKAIIFNELGLYADALDCFNEYLDNHFCLDEGFKKAVEGKISALDNLGMDSSKEQNINNLITKYI